MIPKGTIYIQQNKSYQKYIDLLQIENKNIPIAFCGENILGRFEFISDQEFSPTGISLKLIVSYYNNLHGNNKIKDQVISEKNLSENGSISNIKSFTKSFDIPKEKITFPSYNGRKVKARYTIIVTISRSFFKSNFVFTQPIIILNPRTMARPMSPQKIRPIDLVNLSCQLSLPKLEYSNNEKIEGQLVFVSPQERNILMMTAHLYISEQLGSSPTINTQIFSYELVNGNPLPGTQIPFCLQLGSKKIWTFHPITDKKNTLVKADFKLEIETKTTTGTIRNFVKLNIYQNHFDDDDDINK